MPRFYRLLRYPGAPLIAPLPLQLDAERPLMRLHRGAKLAVIVDIKSRCIAQAERCGRAGIRAISAFADPLHGDALGAEADGDRAEILRDIVDELAVGGQIENLPIENPVVPDLRAHQDPRALHGCTGRHHGTETAELL